jgi:hypothetical protein
MQGKGPVCPAMGHLKALEACAIFAGRGDHGRTAFEYGNTERAEFYTAGMQSMFDNCLGPRKA